MDDIRRMEDETRKELDEVMGSDPQRSSKTSKIVVVAFLQI